MKIEYAFQSSLSEIYPLIADFEKFGALHPYINRMEKTPEGYHVYETVPMFGFLKVNEEYIVRVDELSPMKAIRYCSQVKKSVFLEILFEFSEKRNETIVTETIDIKATPIVSWLMANLMKRAHRKLFDKLKAV